MLAAGRVGPRVPVGPWVDQHLAREGNPATLTEPQRHCGRKGPTRALPRHHDPLGCSTEAGRFGKRPAGDRLAVVEPGRIRVLRSESIADRHHRRVRCVRDLTRNVVHEPDAADAEPAAVEVHDDTRRRYVVPVDPDRDAVDDVVDDLVDIARRRFHLGATRQHEDLRRQVLERLRVERVGLEVRDRSRVEHTFVGHVVLHVVCPSSRSSP